MASYADIQDWVEYNEGWRPSVTWTIDAKVRLGMLNSANLLKQGYVQQVSVPDMELYKIKDAFRHFGMLSDD